MSFIITILAALLVFSAVIAIHEFGHFTVAKLCGIQVNEFSIGMGPVLWKKNHKGTQYSLRALPVGGFVALEGEESPESQQAEAAHTAQEQPAPETEAPVQPTGVPLNEAPVWQRALVMVAGAVMNFVLGFVVLVFLIAAQNEPITSKTIYAIQDGALCGQTGLQAGDQVLAVNGRRCFVANDILYELVHTRSYSADFTVLRDGQKVQLPGVQFDTWQDEQGETHMSIGFSVYGLEKTPGNVLREAGNSVLYYGRIVFTSLIDLLRGRESINNLSGPVGIVSAIGQAASYGWQDLLELLALITVNLGILNLLPFPALDGGKVVFLVIEGVTGHAVPEKLQSVLTLATFGLLFGLMIFATYNDILRLITGTV
ncbi:site-2 protease family protein [Faecalibacterium sp. OM04-11BH]|jgi:regulator of sigma E protease|uniref:M50 family metallopeptidase n=1 Tax=Faecalibacterium sp. OM04-11BH TaxID=2292357 RepID=UPI000E508C71|nr:site-2 protease family protein [Faecalibacterium sp. OM04-11BH]RHV55191.1 RIP metalloprotease RseP [Faecalibacterium sp. OM04-11BH]